MEMFAFIVFYIMGGILSFAYIMACDRPEEPPFHILSFIRWMMMWPVVIVIGIVNKDKLIYPIWEQWKKFFKFHFSELPKQEDD